MEGELEEETSEDNVFIEENHDTRCFHEMAQLWYDKKFCDVHLMVVDTFGTTTAAILAHRIVLASVIPYFKAMFEEANGTGVTLQDHKVAPVKTLVEYAYTGKVTITYETAKDVLISAEKFGLTDIVNFCAQFIGRNLSPENCLGIREFASEQALHDLHELAKTYAIQNFSAVSRGQEFIHLSEKKVEELIRSDDIHVDIEEDVYHALTLWIFHDEETRQQHADILYNHVRFPLMSEKFLNEVASTNQYLQTPKGRLYIKDAYEYRKNPGMIIFSDPKKTQPRRAIQGVICIVGGVNDSSLNDVTLFNPHDNEWKEGPKMHYRRSRLGVALLQGELYAVGGYDLGYSLATCEKYCPGENSWREIASLDTPRRSLALVAMGKRLFALGGYTGSVYLKSVEIYNPGTDEWSPGPPMLEPRSELSAVFLDERIYAIGGNNSSGHLNSVERFDVLNRRWESVAPMIAPKTGAGK